MKKGFTLIELVVYLAITSIIALSMISMLLKYNSSYITSSKEQRDYFYSMEALMFIKNEIDNAKSVSSENNIVELKYFDETVRKLIKINGDNKVVIVHIKNNAVETSNNILTDVSSFEVCQKGSLIYVSITRRNGESYEKCVGIKRDI